MADAEVEQQNKSGENIRLSIQFDVSELGCISLIKSALTGNIIDRIAFCAAESKDPMYILVTDNIEVATVFTAIPEKRTVAVFVTSEHPRSRKEFRAERIFPSDPHSIEVTILDACSKL